MKNKGVLLSVASLLVIGIILAIIALFNMTEPYRETVVEETEKIQIVDNAEKEVETLKVATEQTEQSDYKDLETKEVEQESSKDASTEKPQPEVSNQVGTKEKVQPENNQEKVETTEQQESILKGKIIYIDAGHQKKGSNIQEPIAPGSKETKARVSSGTRGVSTGKYEYELNLEVALKLKKALQDKGVTVYMVRETHDVDISNSERAQLANEVGADLSLRIHADGAQDTTVSGFSVLVPGGKYIDKDMIERSQSIGESLESSIKEGVENKSRGIVTRNDLTGFNWSEVPSVLIEMGFMSNPEEDERMSTEEFQEAIVKAIVAGLESYYLQNE